MKLVSTGTLGPKERNLNQFLPCNSLFDLTPQLEALKFKN